eukprot:Gb_02435 [translate_table: standard]
MLGSSYVKDGNFVYSLPSVSGGFVRHPPMTLAMQTLFKMCNQMMLSMLPEVILMIHQLVGIGLMLLKTHKRVETFHVTIQGATGAECSKVCHRVGRQSLKFHETTSKNNCCDPIEAPGHLQAQADLGVITSIGKILAEPHHLFPYDALSYQ